ASGGVDYKILLPKGGTPQVPVRVQVNEGRMAKGALFPRPGEGGAGFRGLTGAGEGGLGRQVGGGGGGRVEKGPGGGETPGPSSGRPELDRVAEYSTMRSDARAGVFDPFRPLSSFGPPESLQNSSGRHVV